MHGVDIYHGDSENGQINWAQLAATQNFVYIKADEGEHTVDPMFTANVSAAKSHGMQWGTYHFLRLYSPASAILQADNYWSRIKSLGWTLTPAVDCESHDGQGTAAGMRSCIRAFVTEFQRVAGFKPILYTYTSYATDYLHSDFSDCLLWLADYRGYSGNVEGWYSWAAWQYSESGTIPAIANDEVDLDKATVGIMQKVISTAAKPHSKYPYAMSVKCGSAKQRTVHTSASWTAMALGSIRVGDRYEIMAPTDKNGWVKIGLCGRAIGYVSAACF